jgi:hypothetical protein
MIRFVDDARGESDAKPGCARSIYKLRRRDNTRLRYFKSEAERPDQLPKLKDYPL